jgi:hypothetical protein
MQNSMAVVVEARDPQGQLIGGVGSNENTNPFEIGARAIPIIITNSVVFGIIGIAICSKKFSSIISSLTTRILHIQLANKHALITVAIILAIYIGFTASELTYEETTGDYEQAKKVAENLSLDDFSGVLIIPLRFVIISASLQIFGNIRFIPFLVSIALLFFIYLCTKEIAKNHLAGIIALITTIQSNLFLLYDTIATEDNSWTLFYLISIYTIYKKWYVSPISYVLSIMSKALSAAYLPFTLLFIYKTKLANKQKTRLLISYGIISGIVVANVFLGYSQIQNLNPAFNQFLDGFTVGNLHLNNDYFLVLFLLPMMMGLFLLSQRGSFEANNLMLLITGIILAYPLLSLVFYDTHQPYRTIPVVVFFAIGVGVLFSKYQNLENMKKLDSFLVSAIAFATVIMFEISFIFPSLIPYLIS